MQALLDKREDQESKPSKFDDRINLALSGGVIRFVDNTDNQNNIDYSDYAKVVASKAYFEKRIAHETGLLKKSPNNIRILLRIGDVYLSNNKIEKAKIAYTKAFRLSPDNPNVLKRLVQVLLLKGKPEQADGLITIFKGKLESDIIHLHAIVKLIQNKFLEAESLLSRIADDYENYFEVVNSLGISLMSQEKNKQALKKFKQAITLNDAYEPAKVNLALCLNKMGNIDDAIQQYKLTIQTHPSFVTAYNNLYNLLVSEKKYEEAFETISTARTLSTPYNEVQFRIAWSLMAIGRLDEAIEEYHKVLELLPGNSNTMNNIGHCYDRMGEFSKAAEYFEKACRTKDNNIFNYLPYRNLMVISNKLGNFKKAKEIANNILAHHPKDTYALVFQGVDLVEQEKYDAALDVLLKAYEEKPPLISLYISLSFLYSDIFPDYKKAMEVCEYALNSSIEGSSEIINNLVHINLINGHINIAKKYAKFLERNGSVNLCTLALLDLYQGKKDEAKKKYEEALLRVRPQYADRIIQRKYFDLGNYYLKKNKIMTAQKYYKKALEDAPKGFKFVQAQIKKVMENI